MADWSTADQFVERQAHKVAVARYQQVATRLIILYVGLVGTIALPLGWLDQAFPDRGTTVQAEGYCSTASEDGKGKIAASLRCRGPQCSGASLTRGGPAS